MAIALYTSTSELEGTAYFELLLGPYRDECWCEGSRFMDEEAFGFVEPIFIRLCPKYDHYAFTEIGRPIWLDILGELDALRCRIDRDATNHSELARHLSLRFRGGQAKFFEDVAENVIKLRTMLLDLIAWLRAQLNNQNVISVLGL